MAKKRPRLRPPKIPQALHRDQSKRHLRATTIIHPTTTPALPRRVALARAKHSPLLQMPLPTRPTLNDRFQALPSELRSEIFAFLLVEPVKWERCHKSTCHQLPGGDNLTAARHQTNYYACPRCCGFTELRVWRHVQIPPYVCPLRSRWAPTPRNPYVCSECWDHYLRPGTFPRPRTKTSCLCQRRGNLDVMLVCRDWYEEAATLFWTRNTFAFEDCRLFTDFVDFLSPRWKDTVTRVSIMAHSTSTFDDDTTLEEDATDWESGTRLSTIWPRLRHLPSLSYLGLDARFLSRYDTVQSMLRLGLSNLKQIKFTLRNRNPTTIVADTPWDATLLVGGFAEEVARAIKGQRRKWLKRPRTLQAVINEEKYKQEHTNRQDLRNDRGFLELHDDETWRQIWLSGDGHAHAFLPDETIIPWEEHWRHWKPCSVHVLQKRQNAAAADRICRAWLVKDMADVVPFYGDEIPSRNASSMRSSADLLRNEMPLPLHGSLDS